ncbi:MAG: hypothetical protein MR610_05515 [Olsenella sp.]|nr:hypothetical protein [Olsenella sp.]
MMKHMLQPEIDHLLSYARRDMQGPLGDAATNRGGWKIYRQMEPIVPAPDTSEYRSIWICATRGIAENWRGFDDWKDEEACYGDGSPLTEEAWRDEWKSWYPNETRWHLISCAREKGWLSISIDHECILSIEPGHVLDYPDKRRAGELDKLAHVLAGTVGNLRVGRYKAIIEKELPYSCRWGFLRRSTFWRITGVDGRRFGGDLPREQREQLARALRRQPEESQTPRLPELNAGKYFSALKEAYQAAGLKGDGACFGFAASDPRAWYCHLGDARDTDILEIDQDSPAAFRDFMQSSHFFNHTFEVIAGRGCSRVHLWPVLDKEGLWYLHMSGFLNWHASEIALMWEKLNELGMPTYLSDADNLASLLLGEDWVLLAPSNEYIDYLDGQTKFGRRVGLALHLWDEYADSLAAATEWMPVDVPRIAKKAHR